MAIQTVTPFYIPAPIWVGAGVSPVALANVTLNAAGDKVGAVFLIPKTGNVRKIGFLVGAVTTPQNVDVRLETVSARLPSGTLFGTNTNGTVASGSITANTFVYATLTADAVVTVNQLAAISIVPASNPNFNVRVRGTNGESPQIPYVADGSTGTYVAAAGNYPIFALEYDDGSYAVIPGVIPNIAVLAGNTVTFNSSSNPEIVGLKFKLPVPYRVSGVWLAIDLDNATDIVLYDSDGTSVLQTASLTNDMRASTAGVTPFFCRFPSAQSLLANTFYYIGVKPGASSVSIYSLDVPSAAAMDQWDGGQNFHYATWHTNAWTPLTTRRLLIGLEINGIDDGTPAPQVLVIG